MKTQPDIDALIVCSRRLAQFLSLPPAPEDRVRQTLEDILFKRGAWRCFQEKISPLEEVRNLILAHLYTLISSCAGVPEPNADREDAELIRDIEKILEAGNA